MAKRRLRISVDDYAEITTARDWCRVHDFTAFAVWYDELLNDLMRRKALPSSAVELRDSEEERPRNARRERSRDDRERDELSEYRGEFE